MAVLFVEVGNFLLEAHHLRAIVAWKKIRLISKKNVLFPPTLIHRERPGAKGRFDMVAPIPCDLTLTFQKIWHVLEFLKDNWISALEDARVHQAWLHTPGLVSVRVWAPRRAVGEIFSTFLGQFYDLPESFVSLLQKIWMQSWLKGDARLFGKSCERSFGICSANQGNNIEASPGKFPN